MHCRRYRRTLWLYARVTGGSAVPAAGLELSVSVLQQRQGISTGLASSVSSSRTATLTRSRKATQTRTVRETKHTWLDNQRRTRRRGTAQQRAEHLANEEVLQRPNYNTAQTKRPASTHHSPSPTSLSCVSTKTKFPFVWLPPTVVCAQLAFRCCAFLDRGLEFCLSK